MKIIKEGTVYKNSEWWHGATVHCNKCGCIFQVDDGDDVTVVSMYFHIPCPTCNYICYRYR